ncbi:YhbY family RNA-binding protein [Pectinatus cerevisiiphilus]|uniref:RNA-binding protein n=1 Tax=Pectinatus cerevisiiphilus TaxID=86956 RepID=A0A4R3K7A1_9FIRM|nr:YhbY family RNA-binding protein [Pectinatus cerevisiiphilus]TCS78750.1 RNA-binding protein [Pectinatus cerevisiiphilus]
MIRNTLTGKQKRFLRSMGTTLEPVVQIGKEAVTPQLVKSANDVITKRELIKVRVLQNCLQTPESAISLLAERTDCDLVQLIGRNGLLFRRNFKKPKIKLPN